MLLRVGLRILNKTSGFGVFLRCFTFMKYNLSSLRKFYKKHLAKNRARIGVFASDRALEMVEIHPNEQGLFHVASFAMVDLEPGVVEHGDILDIDRLAAAAKKLWSNGGFSTNVVYGALSDHITYFHTFKFPGELSDAEVKSALTFQFEEAFPLAFVDAVIDFAVIARSGEQTVVQCAVVPKVSLQKFQDALERAGLTVGGVGIEAQAIGRVLLGAFREKKASLIANIRKHSITLFIRDMYGLYATFTSKISSDATTSLSSRIKMLHKEILAISEWYARTVPDVTLEELVLTGYVTELPEIEQEVRELVKHDLPNFVEIRIGDIFGRMTDHEAARLTTKEKRTAMYAAPIGMALLGVMTDERPFEFLVSAQRSPSVVRSKRVASDGRKRHFFPTKEDIDIYIATIPERKKIFFSISFILIALMIFGGVLVWYFSAQHSTEAGLAHLRSSAVSGESRKQFTEDISVALAPSVDQVAGRLAARTITQTVSLVSTTTASKIDITAQVALTDMKGKLRELFSDEIKPDERFLTGLAQVTLVSAVPTGNQVTITAKMQALVFKNDDLETKLTQALKDRAGVDQSMFSGVNALQDLRIKVSTVTKDLSHAELAVTVYPQSQ